MSTAIEFNHVGKQYRLGLVSTRTLSHDFNRWWQMAILKKEDPYLKIVGGDGRTVGGDGSGVIPGSTGNLCPVATSLCERVLSLPLHPYMGLEEIGTVCDAIRKALR